MKSHNATWPVALCMAVAVWMSASTALTAAEDRPVTACLNRSGQVRIPAAGDNCKDGETQVTWGIRGPEGSQGPVGSPGAEGSPGVAGPVGPAGPAGVSGAGGMVVDATGAQVGSYQGSGNVLVSVGGVRFMAWAETRGFRNIGGMLLYLSSGCAGTPYMTGQGAFLVPAATPLQWNPSLQLHAAWVPNPNTTVTVTPPAGGYAPIWYRSTLSNGSLDACMSISLPQQMTLFEAESFDLGQFVPPFSLSLPSSCTAAPEIPGFLGWTTAGMARGSVLMFWEPTAAGEPVTSYVLEVGTTVGGSDVAVIDTGGIATSYLLSELVTSVNMYHVRIRAKNACGVSGPSNEANPPVA